MTAFGDYLTEQKLRNGEIDLENPTEEDFFDLLDLRFNFNDEVDEVIFDYQNFFPKEKSVEEGKWIKVPTDIGFNIYYAKSSTKKLNETLINRKIKSLQKKLNAETNLDKQLKFTEDLMNLAKEAVTASLLEIFAYDLKYAKIKISKSKSEFLLPYQYEIINSDIEEYIAAICDEQNSDAVKFKHIFSSDNEDQIFYIRSRGISKETAILMADLKNAYFIVDTQALLNEAIKFELVEK